MMNFGELVGKTLARVVISENKEQINFECTDGKTYRMHHDQDCCENVTVDDVAGDLADIIGSPVQVADESTSEKNPDGVTRDYQDSFTWTFYKIDTAKGGVTIRWYGESNGYYSESVEFEEIAR